MKRRTIFTLVTTAILILGLFGLLLLGLWTGRLGTHRQRLDAALLMGRLAPIPPSATAVRSRAGGTPFTRSFHFCFSAAPDVIERFLADSPSLEQADPGAYRPVVALGHFR